MWRRGLTWIAEPESVVGKIVALTADFFGIDFSLTNDRR
jgi:hypothetical protein